jgi:hypothetical protein
MKEEFRFEALIEGRNMERHIGEVPCTTTSFPSFAARSVVDRHNQDNVDAHLAL